MIENKRILIVDDDPGIRDSYKGILSPLHADNVLSKGASLFDEPVEDAGPVSQNRYDLIITGRGEEGIEAVEKSIEQKAPFAAAFIDMKMPGIDGAETAKGIWAIDPDINIAIVTAYSEHTPDDIVRVTGRDDVFYLHKPFNPEEIRQFARAFTHQWSLEQERKQLHEKLKKLNADLESLVEQRTAELKQAYKKLSSLDQNKMIFLQYLSHEMNTPLNWIGATGVMDREDLSDENRELVDMVEKGFDRLNNLVRAVLSYFELAGSDLNLKLEDVYVREAIFEIINRKADMVEESNLEIITSISETHTIKADPEYLIELLEIFIDNAIAFSEQGGTITIKAVADKERVRLIISDNGKGIEKEDLENIFNPFATEESKRREGGYGLNLPKTKIIAGAHGWQIRAESEGKGHGASFVIET